MRSKSGDSTHLVAIPNHARALPQDDPRRRRAFNGGFIGRDGDLEIVVSWRLVKDSERGELAHELGRPRQSGKPHAFKTATAEVMMGAAFVIDPCLHETDVRGSHLRSRGPL